MARYGAILLLLAAAGLFVGQTSYNAIRGRHWLAVVNGCAAGRPLGTVPDDVATYLRCVSEVEQERAGFTFAGALAVLMLGAALMLLLPYRLLRQARPLRPAEAGIAGRAAEAARCLGLRRPPAVLVGGWRLQEPFTVRALRGTRIILPRGLRRLPPEQIDAVLRHETAHVRAGDVTLVWLTRGVWWALIPALLTPPLLISGRSVVGHPAVLVEAPLELLRTLFGRPYYWNYSLRALVLLAVAAVVSAAVLRSREHEADLAAAAHGDAGMLDLLRDGPPTPTWWRRLQAAHPSARRRLAALGDPHRTMELSTLDAAAAGLLVAMTMPVLHLALPMRPADGLLGHSTHLTGVVAGALFALVWGTALWRAALIEERTGRRMRLGITSATLAVATAAGLLTQIAGAPTLVSSGPFDNPVMLALLPPSVGAAAAASGLLARAWARKTADAPAARPTWAAIAVLNTLIFSGALWISTDTFTAVYTAGNWVTGVETSLLLIAARGSAAGAVGILCVLAFRWTKDRPGPSRTALLTIVPAAAALAVRWLVFTDPTDPLNALYRDLWTMTAAGGAVVAGLLARRGATGLVPAMVFAPAAALLVAAAIWLRYPNWDRPGATAGLYLTSAFAVQAPVYLLAAPLALLTGRSSAACVRGNGRRRRRPRLTPR